MNMCFDDYECNWEHWGSFNKLPVPLNIMEFAELCKKMQNCEILEGLSKLRWYVYDTYPEYRFVYSSMCLAC